MRVVKCEANPRVYFLKGEGKRRILVTKNLIKGFRFSDERIFTLKKIEYREWIPQRSKIAAALVNGLKLFPLEKGDKILYLGAAAGQTASYCSDIVGNSGIVFCVEISERVLRELILKCRERKNMLPILADASKPEEYEKFVTKDVDFVFQDIAQPNQVEIFVKNCKKFLKKHGYGMIAVKSRSIDVTEKPKRIFKKVKEELLKEGFSIEDKKRLEPFEKDHCVFLVRQKT